jgi:ADP-heptose:LPS heptosyltransferase
MLDISRIFIKNNAFKRITLYALNFVYFFTDTLCLSVQKKIENKNGVALIKLDGVGDFFMWLRYATTYKHIYEGKKITLIADSTWSNFAAELPYWDEVISVNTKKLYTNVIYRWSIIKKINNIGFELAIEPTYSRVFLHGDSVLRATSADERIGFVGDDSNTHAWFKKISNQWYTKLFQSDSHDLMELDRNQEFLINISGGNGITESEIDLPLNVDLNNNWANGGDYFIIFPGVSWAGKKWSSENFAKVAFNIAQQKKWRLILCGGANERSICAEVIQLSGLSKTQNLAGQTTLSELAILIKGAKLLIGNDTAAIHLAALVQTPSVSILGGGHYGRFLPYSDQIIGIKPIAVYEKMPCYHCNWRCTENYKPSDPVPCIEKISSDKVLQVVKMALE